jgi:IS30 family transposase
MRRSIARSIVHARGALKKERLAPLRRRHPLRRSRRYATAGQPLVQIIDAVPIAVPIAALPASIADRAVPGHWEGDLLAGAKNTHIATLVERQSRFVQLIKVPRKDAETVARALTRHVQRLPDGPHGIAHVGSRPRDGAPQTLQRCDRRCRLLR